MATRQEIVVKVLDVLSEGNFTRPVAYCGQSLAKAGPSCTKLNNSVLFSPKHKHTHTHTQGGLTCCLKMWLVKLWTKWSSLGKRWHAALRGFPWESLQTIITPCPSPSTDTMESQTVRVKSVYLEGRALGSITNFIGQE